MDTTTDVRSTDKLTIVKLRKAGVSSQTIADAFQLTRQQVSAYVAWATMSSPRWVRHNAAVKAWRTRRKA